MGPVVIISFVANHMHSTLTVRRSGYVIRRSRFNFKSVKISPHVGQDLDIVGQDKIIFVWDLLFSGQIVVPNFKGWPMREI